mgnify:CR=1 FL=1
MTEKAHTQAVEKAYTFPRGVTDPFCPSEHAIAESTERRMTTFAEWMLSCGHQIGCGVHASRGCSCSALRGAQAKPGNPACSIPHAPSGNSSSPGQTGGDR